MQRRLAELDIARKQFIANASHELRTPIFSLGGFVELLEEEDPEPGRAGRVRAHDARADRAADEADHRSARPLPARRGGDGDDSRAASTSASSPARRRASSAPAPRRTARALQLRTADQPVIAPGRP